MDKRVKFDFEIDFTNGGGLQGCDFRLDIPGGDISDDALADAIVRDMRLLMVGDVRIRNKEIIEEEHKRRVPDETPPGRPEYVDLSHTIRDGLVTYKGFPPPVIRDYLSRVESRKFYAPGTEFQVSRIEMVASTGTYLDCPYHRYADGKDLSQVRLENLVDLEGLVVRTTHRETRAIGVEFFAGREVRNRAVLVHTGWDRHWEKEDYFHGHPYLTGEAAISLRDRGARLVGIDSMNIDDTRGGNRPVHSILLESDILIVEHLCRLDRLPDEGFTFSVNPPAFESVGSFPVRAVAKLR